MTTVTLRIAVDKSGATENIGAVKNDLRGMGEEGQRSGAQASQGVNGLSSALQGARQAVTAFLAVYAGIQAISGVVRLADEYAQLTGQLQLVTSSTEEFAAAQSGVFAIAQQTGSALGSVNSLYASLARSTEELNLSQGDLLTITQAVSQSFVVSNTSAGNASAAITQLGQAFASGVLRGDEFNSIAENAPRLMDALATSLDVTRGELRRMAEQGQLTSDVLARGLLDQAPQIASEFGTMGQTVSRAFQALSNAVLRFVGEASESTGAATALAAVITGIANGLPAIVFGLTAVAAGYAAVALASAGANAGLFTTAGLVGALATGFGALIVAYSAYKLGEYLVNEFTIVQAAVRSLYVGVNDAWTAIKVGALAAFMAISNAWRLAVESMGSRLADLIDDFVALSEIELPFGLRADFAYGQAEAMTALSASLRQTTSATIANNAATSALQGEIDKTRAEAEEYAAQMFDVVDAHAASKIATVATTTATKDFTPAVVQSAAAVKAMEKAQSDANSAFDALTDEINRQAAQAGGPLVAAYVQLAGRLRDVDAQEVKLRASNGLSRAEAELLRTARLGLTDALVKEVAALNATLTPAEQHLEKLREELRLAGMVGSARAAAVIQSEAETTARGLLKKATEEQIKALADEIAALEGQTAAAEKSSRAAESWNRYWGDAIGAVSDAFGDFVASGFKSFSDFGDQLKQIARRIISDLVSQFIRSRITIPITAALQGSGGAGGPLGSLLGGGGGGAGGLLGSLLGGAGSLFGGALGTGLTASAGIFGASGLFGGIAGSIGAGVSSIAGGAFLQGVGLLLGPIGLIGGAIAVLSGILSDNQETILRVRSQEFNGDRRARGVETSALGNIFVRGETLGDGAAVEIAGAIRDFDNIIAGFLSPDQLAAVRIRLNAVNDTFRDGSANVATALDARFSAILGVLGSDIQEFVGTVGPLEDRVQRLADAMIITSAAATGLISDDFGEVADVLERFRAGGEGLGDTFGRIVSGMSLVDDALLLLDGTFSGTRLQAANFAGELIELSGGFDQFAARLNGALETLFSQDERNQFIADQSQAALNTVLTDLNIQGTGVESIRNQLRDALREALSAGNAALVDQILTAANALGAFGSAVEALGADAVAAANATVFGGTSVAGGGNAGTAGAGTGATPVATQLQASQAAARALERHTGLLEQIATNTRPTVGVNGEKSARDTADAGRESAATLRQIKTLIEAAVRSQAQESIKKTTGANNRAAA